MFGPHLMLELYGSDKKIISNIEKIREFLNNLPDVIGMHKISEPMILEYAGKEGSFDKGGISAFVIIAESHISIHTFIAQQYATIDIFSCKPFDFNQAQAWIKDFFKPSYMEAKIEWRGKEFSKEPKAVVPLIKSQRKALKKIKQ